MIMAAEKNFENKVKKFLKEKGCWILKYWGGAAFTKSGIPDLLVCCKGHFIGVELKAPKGKPSDLQIYNLREIDKSGGYAVLLYPDQWELFQNFILCIVENDPDNTAHNYNILKSRWKHFENKILKGE
jgi:hypothetical protein